MKTQCPNCGKQFNAPDEYEGKKVKCTKCHFVFYAQKAEAKINELLKKVAQKKVKGQNFIPKIWNNSPIAFRTAFLATFGVISALVIAYICLDWLYLAPKNSANSQANISNHSVFKPIIDPNYQWKVIGKNDLWMAVSWKFKVYASTPGVIAGQIDFLDKDGFVLISDPFPPTEIKGIIEISQSLDIHRSIGRQITNMQIIFKK